MEWFGGPGDRGPWLKSSYQVGGEAEQPNCWRLICFSLSKAILYTETAAGVFPFDGAIDAGDLTGAAFQTTGKLNHHLSLFVKGVKVCRAGVNAESFFAGVADFLIKRNVGLFVILKSIQG